MLRATAVVRGANGDLPAAQPGHFEAASRDEAIRGTRAGHGGERVRHIKLPFKNLRANQFFRPLFIRLPPSAIHDSRFTIDSNYAQFLGCRPPLPALTRRTRAMRRGLSGVAGCEASDPPNVGEPTRAPQCAVASGNRIGPVP